MLGVREIEQAEISPDGKRVAWVQSEPVENRLPANVESIYVTEIAHPAVAHRVTAARPGLPALEHDVAWSPDGKYLAFLSDAGSPRQPQLYEAPITGGAARRLTLVKGSLSSPGWSPDGKNLSVLFVPGDNEAGVPNGPVPEPANDEESESFGEQQRLVLIDRKTASMRSISPLDLYVYEYDWSPDGKNCAVTAAQGDGEENWYNAGIYSIDTAHGATIKLFTPTMQIGEPRWSPDGSTVAFIGGLMSNQHEIGGDIYVVPATGGEPKDVTPGLTVTASSLRWLSDSKEILFAAYAGGGSGLGVVDISTGEVHPAWQSEETISAEPHGIGLSATADGESTVVVKQSFQHPPEIWAGHIGGWKQVTHFNDKLESQWGDGESLHWRNGDFDVQGWLIFPRDYDSSKSYPLVIDLHDGPAAAVTPVWPTGRDYAMALSAAEYFVLRPNPRGSYGQGESYVRANVKDLGDGEMKDILAGIDIASKAGTADASRVGITGWGYGGYLSMWAITQTTRFIAAVAGPGIASFQSYFGETTIGPWMLPYFGVSPYDDPAAYARSSPITFIKKVKTPTLLFSEDRDSYFPEAQSDEFWRALKRQQVPTRLLAYPGDSIFMNAEQTRNLIERTYAWFYKYFPPFPLP